MLVAKVTEQQLSQAFGAYRVVVFARNIRTFLASVLDMFVGKTEPTALKCIVRAA